MRFERSRQMRGREQRFVLVPEHVEVGEIGQRVGAALAAFTSPAATKRRTTWATSIDREVRDVQRLLDGADPLVHLFGALGRPSSHSDDRWTAVEDDHGRVIGRRARLGPRSADISRVATRSRLRTRSATPGAVGRSTFGANSASEYSDSDIPSIAARAFNRRCTSSGTFRIWSGFMHRTC